MSQAADEDFKDKLEDDSFAEMMSQADDREFNIESPKSKKSNVENWLVTLEQSKKENQKISLEKRKLEITNPNIQNKQFCKDPFTTENYVNTNSLMIMQAQQALKRQEFFSNFFAEEQKIHKEQRK